MYEEQSLVAFRHAPNLEDKLVRGKLPQLQTVIIKGCFKSGKSRCQICKFMLEEEVLGAMVRGERLRLGVVYLLGCRVCGKQYVGSTYMPFRHRIEKRFCL